MPAERTLECDLKTEVDYSCRTELTLRCYMKTEVDFSCRAGKTCICDLKPKSTLDFHVERTLEATTVVNFVPRGVDLRCKIRKELQKAK
jgi:hypothetical protein